MYAIVETGGKQVQVEVGQAIYVEKLNVEVGETFTFDKVLFVSGENTKVGTPYVEGATVTVNGCTNVNGNMNDVVNVHGTSMVVLDGKKIRNHFTMIDSLDISDELGFGYIKSLAENFYGIKDIVYIKAEGLDIYGANTEDILEKAKKDIDQAL